MLSAGQQKRAATGQAHDLKPEMLLFCIYVTGRGLINER